MIPSPLPLNGIALLAVFTPSVYNGKQLSIQHKHRIIIVHPICSSKCICVPSFLDCPTALPFFFFFYPFTQPFSAPVLGACPGFRQGSVCSQPWQPATLLFLAPCPTILETSPLLPPRHYNPYPTHEPVPLRASRRTQVQTETP